MSKKQSFTNKQILNNSCKKEVKSFIRKNKIDLIFISLIAIFTLIIVYLLININNQLGIYCSDVFIYLLNSLNFAGYSIGTRSTMYLSPIICFLTSLIFKTGFINQVAIFTVTGLFFPIASIGLYLLCRLHLNKLISLFAAFLFINFSLNILWAANGSLDIPAIAISIWIMYFSVLAVDKDPKYFTIAFPLFVIGFFTRYTVGFILPLMILYILFKIDLFDKIKLIFDKKLFKRNINNLIKSKSFKYSTIGIVIATGILTAVLSVLLKFGSNLTFISQTQDVISGGKGSTIDPGFNPDSLFYLTNLPNFISSTKISFDGPIPILEDPTLLSYFILGLIILGFLFYISKILIKLKNRNIIDKKEEQSVSVKIANEKENIDVEIPTSNKYSRKFHKILPIEIAYIKIIGVAMLSVVLIATYKEVSSVISEVLFLINILLVFNILNKYSIKDLNFNLSMFSWFIVYLIFFSFTNIKVDRYFITVMPVIAYFAAYSLNFLINEINKINFVKNNLFIKLNIPFNSNKLSNSKTPLNTNKLSNLNKLFKIFKQDNEDSPVNESVINNMKTEQNTLANEKIIANEKIKESKCIDDDNSQKSILSITLPIILIIIFLMSTFTHLETIPTKNDVIQDPIKASEWLMSYDPDYDSKVIWTHNRRYYAWYLKTNVSGAYETDLPKLKENNVSYLIFNKYILIENYTLIKSYNHVYIYKKIL